MREIKFRAWNKKTNEMLPAFDNKGYHYALEGAKWPDIYSIMQYTGLRDKNGKEIYEGDIVEYIEDMGGIMEMGSGYQSIKQEVKFKDGCFEPVCGIILEDTEIIGNIYQNPELLK